MVDKGWIARDRPAIGSWPEDHGARRRALESDGQDHVGLDSGESAQARAHRTVIDANTVTGFAQSGRRRRANKLP